MYERGYRHLGRSVMVLLGIGVFYFVLSYSIGYVSGPTLYDGDRLETRQCRQCGGSGSGDPGEGEGSPLGLRCPFCAGKGTVEVIIPGPNRPSRVWGAVVGLEASGGTYAFSNPRNTRGFAFQAALMPGDMGIIQGALPNTKVVFEAPGLDAVEVKSDSSGRFSVSLRPAAYSVAFSCEGFQDLQGRLDVQPLEEPIWLEKATLVQEPTEESRGSLGLSLLAAMAKPGQRGAFVRVESASF